MSAVLQEAPLRLPGHMGPVISSASDEQLKQCLREDLDANAGNATRLGVKLDRDGMFPKAWFEEREALQEKRPSHDHDLGALRRIDRRIRAIRAELVQRETRRKQEAKRHKEGIRKRLEAVLEFAPANAEALKEAAVEVVAAQNRVAQLAADLRLLGGALRLAERVAVLRAGVETAAGALGQKAPKLPAIPELPAYESIAANLRFFQGPRDGYDDLMPKIGDAAKADALVLELKS